jgi:crotonobetainyl-CoA:carnitine CoA-transferase CaiB-like acyl-CoA transferase
MAGLAYMTGPPGQPLRAGASVVDIMGGMFAVIGVQAALRERERTGRGQMVKSALFESTGFLMMQHMAGEVVTGKPMPPMPSRQGAWAVYEPFETADGKQIFVGLTSDGHWRRFCEHFKRADLQQNPAYKTNEDRVRARPELLPVVAAIVARHSLAELAALFDRLDVPFAPVAQPGDLFDDPQLNAGGRMLEVAFANGAHAKIPRLPIEIGDHDFGLRRQAPAIGEHTGEILAELGVAQSEIEALARRHVVTLGATCRAGEA